MDIVWDQYFENSLKSQATSKRGKGVRRRVNEATNLPRYWQARLSYSPSWQTISHTVSTKGSGVLCIPPRDTSHLAPCDREEADTRMILHLADAVKEGFRKIFLRTLDTDVVVLAVAAADKLDVQKLWAAFGTGKNFRYIPVHEISISLGPCGDKPHRKGTVGSRTNRTLLCCELM